MFCANLFHIFSSRRKRIKLSAQVSNCNSNQSVKLLQNVKCILKNFGDEEDLILGMTYFLRADGFC